MEAPSSPLLLTITITLDQAALLNAALAKYWLHTKNRAELQVITPQVADLQRQLVDQIRREGECHHATTQGSPTGD